MIRDKRLFNFLVNSLFITNSFEGENALYIFEFFRRNVYIGSMITPSTIKVLIVPDFGVSAENRTIVSLKEAIESRGHFSVKIVDLQQLVRDEHPGKQLKEAAEIELCARLLEALAADKSLVWDHQADDDCSDPVHTYVDGFLDDSENADDVITGMKENEFAVDGNNGAVGDVAKPNKLPFRRLRIHKTVTDPCVREAPSLLVVFGKSVMLAGGITDKSILFVKPTYDSEWPWKKQFYADHDAAADFQTRYFTALTPQADTQVLWDGSELSRLPEPTLRCGMFTDADNDSYSHFCDLYDDMAVVDKRLDDTEHLAKAICEFAEGDMELPPLATHRSAKDGDRPSKRVLIVPDYFTPYNSPAVVELRDRLRQLGHYVAVYVHGQSFEKSRTGIECRCKQKPFDIVVALETGCLVTSRITNCTRIFVNPDWQAWEWMKHQLGDNRRLRLTRGGNEHSGPFWSYDLDAWEVAEARRMAERSYIRRGEHCVFGWFSECAVDGTGMADEHIKRFNSCTYIPGMRLDTDTGIAVLAKQIDKIIQIDED